MCLKDWKQDIIVFKFIFLYSQLNLVFFLCEKRETIQKTELLEKKLVEIFEYKKNNDGY